MSVGNLNPGCCACGGGGVDGTTAPYPGCFCTSVPETLTMTSCSTSCNFHMFQPCTITYQPTPAVFASLPGLGANIWSSYPTGFPDPAAGGATFYYYLNCSSNEFALTRLYPTSPFGSPYRDAILYTWFIGGGIDTCSPFVLKSGNPFGGSDPTCCVTIHGSGTGTPACTTSLGVIC